MALTRYADWAPSAHDTKGLNLPDRQDWYVAPCIRTRDSDPWQESNFAAQLSALGGESETVEEHSFGHWACGHFDIVLVHPSRVNELEDIVARLEDYPYLDEDDVNNREYEDAFLAFAQCGYRDVLRKALVETFELSETTDEWLQDVEADALWGLMMEHGGGYEHAGHDVHFDFRFVEREPGLTRDQLAAFIRSVRAEKRKQVSHEPESEG